MQDAMSILFCYSERYHFHCVATLLPGICEGCNADEVYLFQYHDYSMLLLLLHCYHYATNRIALPLPPCRCHCHWTPHFCSSPRASIFTDEVPANEYPIAATTLAETTLHYSLLYRWSHSGGSFGSMQTFPGLLLIYHHSTTPHHLVIVLHLLYLIFLALLSCWLFCYLCCLPLYYYLCKQTLMECLACHLNTK